MNIFFGIFAIRSLCQVLKIYIIRNYYAHRHTWEILRLLLVDGLMLAWLVYGNKLYWSKDNNCGQVKNTSFLNSFMAAILFIGYIVMAFYFVLLCTIPCFYLYVLHVADQIRR